MKGMAGGALHSAQSLFLALFTPGILAKLSNWPIAWGPSPRVIVIRYHRFLRTKRTVRPHFPGNTVRLVDVREGPIGSFGDFLGFHLSNQTMSSIDCLRKSRGLHSVSAYRHGLYIYRSMPAGGEQSRHAFVGGTVSTWAR